MDPTQCLKELLELLAEYQESREYMADSTPTMKWYREETIEHLENLLRWLKKGGFMPKLPDKYTPGRQDQAVESLTTALTQLKESIKQA